MTKPNDGGPVFPYTSGRPATPLEQEAGIRGSEVFNPGLSKRELFAAMAMQGLCSNASADYSSGKCNASIVERAGILADALIAELEKGNV
jgi:hypothetical protein